MNKGLFISKSKTKPASTKGMKGVQPKFQHSGTGDRFEQEADAMADHVIHPGQNKTKPETGLIASSIQKKTEQGPVSSSTGTVSGLNVYQGMGSSLPGTTRRFMEGAFSADFSNVRIHTDARAAEMSHGMHARAFTYGNHIYFNANQFSPEQTEGKRLLAHELTHVLQQSNGGSPRIQRKAAPGETAESKPPVTTMGVTLSSVEFAIQGEAKYKGSTPEDRLHELIRIVLRRILGEQTTNELIENIANSYSIKHPQNEFDGRYLNAKPGTLIKSISFDLVLFQDLVNLIEDGFKLKTILTDDQKEIIALGIISAKIYQKLKDKFPKWYDEFIFTRDMSQQGDLLRTYVAANKIKKSGVDFIEAGTLDTILNAISPSIKALELIRKEFELANKVSLYRKATQQIKRKGKEERVCQWLIVFCGNSKQIPTKQKEKDRRHQTTKTPSIQTWPFDFLHLSKRKKR